MSRARRGPDPRPPGGGRRARLPERGRRRDGSGDDHGTAHRVLRGIRYFDSLPAAELEELATACPIRRLGAGAVVFEEGQAAEGLFIITDGAVEVRQVSLGGREQVFHTEGPGATLGEAPLFDGGGYIASAVALTEARVMVVPRAAVLGLCRRQPEVALAMLETLARRIRRFAELVADLAFRRVSERVARHLDAASAGRPDGAVPLALTHAQLAARLGTVRELVARALAQLERDGVITRARSTIVIRNRARLAALARGEPDRRL